MIFDNYGIHVGFLYIRYYGIIIMSGALAGMALATYDLRRKGYDPELLWDLAIWLLLGSLLGARLWHIFTPSPSLIAQGVTTKYYLTHPLQALAIWNGGIGIIGAILGGLFTLFLYSRKHRMIGFVQWVDFIAPGLALGQAIGRWGNFVNQELYGAPSGLPWAIYIDVGHRLPKYLEQAYYHPIFLYESLWSLFVVFFLLWLRYYREKFLEDGDIFLIYLVTYSVIRFLLEFVRLDSSMIAGINANQTVMAIVALIATSALFIRHRGR